MMGGLPLNVNIWFVTPKNFPATSIASIGRTLQGGGKKQPENSISVDISVQKQQGNELLNTDKQKYMPSIKGHLLSEHGRIV